MCRQSCPPPHSHANMSCSFQRPPTSEPNKKLLRGTLTIMLSVLGSRQRGSADIRSVAHGCVGLICVKGGHGRHKALPVRPAIHDEIFCSSAWGSGVGQALLNDMAFRPFLL